MKIDKMKANISLGIQTDVMVRNLGCPYEGDWVTIYLLLLAE
jgi:hypothetical protein